MAKAKKITAAEAMDDLKKRKHQVEKTDAAAMVKKYQGFRTKLASAKKNGGAVPPKTPDLPISVSYNKKAIQSLLKQPGCEGIRIFPAIKDDAVTFVLVAINAAGENITESATSGMAKTLSTTTTTVDEGQMSPPYPATTL